MRIFNECDSPKLPFQIAAAEADYQRRIRELDSAMEKVDIIADPVANGVLNIRD